LASLGFRAIDIGEAETFDPDLVVIATETLRHIRDSLPWLEKGAWVLIEKPAAVDVEELRSLAQYDRVRVACCMRGHEGIRWLRERLPRLGRISAVRIEAQSYLPDWRPDHDYRESYSADPCQGGVLRDLIHEIDYALWLFGYPKEIQAWLGTESALGIPVDTNADLTWPLCDGGRLTMRLDFITRTSRRRVTVDGELGSLGVDLLDRSYWASGENGQISETLHGAEPYDRMYVRELESMLNLTDGGEDELPLPSFDGVMKAMQIVEAARNSSDAGGSSVGLEDA
jgi:predicted dehydrogenase